MNADDLRDVAERLEALESLAKLFGNSWLEYAKSQIPDEKIRAYLTVFDDAFPGLEHIVEFVSQNAHALAAGEGVQENFAGLAQALLQREIAGAGFITTESDAEVVGEITASEDDAPRADAEQDIEVVPEDDAPRAASEESIETAPEAEQADAKKSTSNEEESKDEDKIDAFFG